MPLFLFSPNREMPHASFPPVEAVHRPIYACSTQMQVIFLA